MDNTQIIDKPYNRPQDLVIDMNAIVADLLRYFQLNLFSQTNNCAPRTISFLSFHTFFIVYRSILTVTNLMKVKAQQSFKKFHW